MRYHKDREPLHGKFLNILFSALLSTSWATSHIRQHRDTGKHPHTQRSGKIPEHILFLPIIQKPGVHNPISGEIPSNYLESNQVMMDYLDAGATHYSAMRWSELETAPGEYNMTLIDKYTQEVNAMRTDGITVIVQFQDTTEYARIHPEISCSPYAPEFIQNHLNFMDLIISKLDTPDLGLKLLMFEPFNEPEVPYYSCLPKYYGGYGPEELEPTISDYYDAGFIFGRDYLQVIYDHLHALDIPVVSPGFMLDDMHNHTAFVEGILAGAGGTAPFDAAAMHNYNYLPYAPDHIQAVFPSNWEEGLQGKLQFMRDTYGQNMPLITLEIGGMCVLFTPTNPEPPECLQGTIFDHYKGRYYITSLLDYLSFVQDQNPKFTIFNWFGLQDLGWKTIGLRIGDDLQDSAVMVHFFFTLFFGSTAPDAANLPEISLVEVTDTISYYEFNQPSGLGGANNVHMYVSNTTIAEVLPLPPNVVGAYDFMGSQINIEGETEMSFSGLPVYLVVSP